MVKIYLSRLFVNLGSLGRQWGTPQVIRLLFGRKYVNIDRPGHDDQTPLSWTVGNGCGGLVKLLLGQSDVSPDKPDNHGRTPLSLAAIYRRDRVVQLL